MQLKRPRLFYSLFVVAIFTTLLFALSTIWAFGISTHRSNFLSWNASTSGYGLAQINFYHGQFHVSIDFARPAPRYGGKLVPRGWYAGFFYFPGCKTDLQESPRLASKFGCDAFLILSGTYFGAGVFGLYPTIIAWLLVWCFSRKKKIPPGHCVACGYDMRATPDRCPECGRERMNSAAH